MSTLPTPGRRGTAIGEEAMCVAVRMWLGAPPRSTASAPRCLCNELVDADGRHFLRGYISQKARHNRLHNHIVQLLEAALKQSKALGDVAVERSNYDRRRACARTCAPPV